MLRTNYSKWVKEINRQRQEVKEAILTLSNLESWNRISIKLTKLQKQGKITEFHGRVRDLGVIDDKYDIAVSTTCPHLNNLVVATVEGEHNCLYFIKKE